MMIAPGGARQLVELKAVDDAYPLVGAATLDPPGTLALEGAVVADPLVADRLGIHPGDQVRLGRATLTFRAALTQEPDKVAGPAILGPRAMISAADLPATDLIQPGSLLTYDLRAVLPPTADRAAVLAELRAAFPGAGWRIRDATQAAPGVGQFVDQTSMFMTLVGLTALLVGGIGVATGVRAWLEARARSIATLRCLGASAATIFATMLIQVTVLTVIALAIGLVVGAALPYLAVAAFGDALPVPPAVGLYPRSLALAAGFGVLTAGAFALWPLARAAQMPGAALFRDATLPAKVRVRPWLVLTQAALIAALVGLTIVASPERALALYFCGGAAATLLLFRGGGSVLMALARRAPHLRAPLLNKPWARLGIANLARPGSSTPLLLVSLGLGLSTLAAVALIQVNIQNQVLGQLPRQAPTFFFIDIQNDQIAPFRAILAAQPGVGATEQVPSLRARMISVAGVPAADVKATPDTRWALRGDRGLTYSATVPEGSRVVEGAWWPPDYAGPPLVSFDVGLARGWGVHVGDVLRVNVLGRDLDLKVANLREISWRTLSINFTLVASPGLLSAAPHSTIATVRTTPAAEGPVLRAVTDALPNVSGIRVADVLEGVASLVRKLAAALAATGSVTLAAGALVLVGAIAAGQRRRTAEAVVLKTLGATSGQVRAAWLVEFGLIGATAGVIAAVVGTGASYGVVHGLMQAEWSFLPGVLAATIVGCVLLMLVFGYAGTSAALRARAAPYLRQD